MNKAEKFLAALSALCVVLTLVYFALPAPQAVFSVRPLAAAGTPAPESRLDVNRATAEQLEQLPGIGAGNGFPMAGQAGLAEVDRFGVQQLGVGKRPGLARPAGG